MNKDKLFKHILHYLHTNPNTKRIDTGWYISHNQGMEFKYKNHTS